MIRNMGTIDRALRAVLGIVLLVYAAFGNASGLVLVIVAAFGAIMLATSALSFCPLYRPFGLRTCKDC